MKRYLYSLVCSVLVIGLTIATGYSNDISYTYDQLNRLIGVVYSDGTRIEYIYDDVGNRVIRNATSPSSPEANFTASPASGPVPLTVSFTDQSVGTVTSWSWSFGDGASSSTQNPDHTYNSAETYTAILTVSNGVSSSSQSKTITVSPAIPVANFTASAMSGTAPLAISFADSSTGDITGWSWTFGDGGTSTSQNPGHTYANPGNYTVTLTVSGPTGTSEPDTASISVVPPPPVANFSATPTSGTVPLAVQFTDTSTGPVTGWSWNFGDGTTSTSQNPNHTYSAAGTYTVSITTTGPGGSNTNTITKCVTVNAPNVSGIDQYTKLMLHFNGPNGSRTFTDSEGTPKTVTAYGNAQISTAYSEFGGASLKLDGSSYLSAPPSSDWNFSGDFTIDFWWCQPTAGAIGPIISAGSGYSLVIQNYYGTVYVWISSNGTSWDIANEVKIGTPSGTGFDHYALVRVGNIYNTYQNGVLTNSFANPLPPYYGASNSLYIGAHASYDATGYLDELRISNGVARWLSNFTPPTSEYGN